MIRSSAIAHLNGVQVVAGSNPATPTIDIKLGGLITSVAQESQAGQI